MTPRTELGYMGYSVRTESYRFTTWLKWDGAALKGDWGGAGDMTELYNHTGDAGTGLSALDDYENVNLAREPENAGLVRELMAQLRAHFDPVAWSSSRA